MKKTAIIIIGLLVTGAAFADVTIETAGTQEARRTGLTGFVSMFNTNSQNLRAAITNLQAGAFSDSVVVATNLTVGGTAQIDGVVTSGKTGSNGGLVVKSTGAGATTFSVAGASGDTTIAGTLGVTGVATFTAAPKVTAVTAAGTTTATMTNAPALTADDAPVWVTVTIGTDNYVIPAFKLGD
jgi:hypothetical protein